MDYPCPQNCQILFLSELYVCTQKQCLAPQLRCRNCFRKNHCDEVAGKFKQHPHQPFDESFLFKNFLYLIKISEIIEKRMKANFNQFTPNAIYFSNMTFFSGTEVQSFFKNQQIIHQFSVLRQIYYKRKASFDFCPTVQFQSTLYEFNDKKYHKIIEQLTRPSFQQTILEESVINACGNKSLWVQQFIVQEQEFFSKYCEQLVEKNQGLDIMKYLQHRRKHVEGEKLYYNRDFENFMEDTYEKRPKQKGLFTLSEYSRHVWAHLQGNFVDPNIEHYFDEWVKAYLEYSKLLKQYDEQENMASFRMWKQQNYPYTGVLLRNIYFLENYIIGYIQYCMYQANYGIRTSKTYNWKQYAVYLKDFCNYIQLKGIQFVNMYDYHKYFNLRDSEQTKNFLQFIRTSPEIVFNKVYAVEYINKVFKDEGMISLKGYKKYIGTKEQQLKEKKEKDDGIANELKQILMKEEGERFYLTIFNSYVAEAIEEELQINKEQYLFYKSKVLEKFDQKTIRMENQALQQQAEYEETNIEAMKSDNDKIKYQINEDEEVVHDFVEDSSDEEGPNQEQLECPCCKGDPYNCSAPQCQMMNCCVTCSYV